MRQFKEYRTFRVSRNIQVNLEICLNFTLIVNYYSKKDQHFPITILDETQSLVISNLWSQ